MNRKGFLFAVVALVSALLTGCGGGGGVTTPLTGRAVFNIVWPQAGSRAVSRLIPLAANSIKIELKDSGGSLLDSSVLNRATSSHTFNDLPVGNVSATASTFASSDGTGNALSTNTVAITIVANQTVTQTINMATTITALVSDYNRTDIFNGDAAVPVSISGRNANGDILPITTSALTWTSSNTAVVTAANEALSYAAPGTANVTVLDTESNISVVIPVICMDITVSGTTTVNVRGSQTYTATVLGPGDTTFTWSKVSGNGTVNSSSGVFAAPNTPGTTVLRVTSNFDAARHKDVTVTVQAGNANITVSFSGDLPQT
jgi:hypothetical protein